jgi:hypothetical protein
VLEKNLRLNIGEDMMRFTNPWGDHEGFISLGTHTYSDSNNALVYFEVYALTNLDPHTIDFGARYDDEPSSYLSGSAFFHKGIWEISCGGSALLTAAARYFANHHKKLKEET